MKRYFRVKKLVVFVIILLFLVIIRTFLLLNSFNNFTVLGNLLRDFKNNHQQEWENYPKLKRKSMFNEWIKPAFAPEKQLFKWIKPTFTSTVELRASFKGDGIVICVGNKHIDYAVATIKIIRNTFKSLLPFEVFYLGHLDLSTENRARLEQIPFVKTVDIYSIFNNDIIKLSGWSMKPFALLASSFQNAMLVDADVIFLQSPQLLFDSKLFIDSGALFFRDRSLFIAPQKEIDMFYQFMPNPPSQYSASFRVFQNKTEHEQESGVVLIDKTKRFVGLMATCAMNTGKMRELVYENVLGDKETFWLGFETVLENYTFNPSLPGAIGVSTLINDKKKICARQLLHAVDNKPFWINGGIAVSKYDRNSDLAELNEWAIEPGTWSMHELNLACIVVDQTELITPTMSRQISEMGKIILNERKSK